MFVLPISRFHARAACAVPPVHLLQRAVEHDNRVPRLDVLEGEQGFTIALDMPGTEKSDVSISVEGRRVTVSTAASKSLPTQGADGGARVLHRERGTAPYARTVVLPAEVDNASSQARLENGVLTLTLARRKPNRIEIN